MPDRRTAAPPFGSTDWAAKQFLRILDREEEQMRSARPAERVASISEGDFPYPLDEGPELPRVRTRNPKSSPPRSAPRRQGPPSRVSAEPYIASHLAGLLSVLAGAVEQDELQDYGAVKMATAESVGSQLPGREHGPADAYRHILWAAELTRRFGERRARELLRLHEIHGNRTGQQPDEAAMDRHNNELGVRIGSSASSFDEVLTASRKAIGESAGDGRGQWKTGHEEMSAIAPYGAAWLDESRWKKNPRVPRTPTLPSGVPFRAPYPITRELTTSEANWYTNPERPNGPDWLTGIVPEPYRYTYGSTSDRTGANDPKILRATNLYRSFVNRPWLVWLNEQW